MDSTEFRKAAHSAIDEIIDYYDTIQDRRVVSNVEPGYLRKLLPSGPPEKGEKWHGIQNDIESKIMPGLTHWQSPNFMAFFPASATYPSILGEMYSAAFTAPAFNWLCSPAVTELETIVLDWLARILGLPSCFLSDGEGGGVIQGSASETVVTVMIAARERYLDQACGDLVGEAREEKKAFIRSRLVALSSEEAHSATAKAARILDVRYRSIRTSMEDDLALTGQNLRVALKDCQRDNLKPFYVTTTLGTTATCATDRFEEIKDVAKSHPELWIHVDAAYAGAALVCEEYQHVARPFDSFDSFNMNMHKWLLTNFDASCLFIKRRTHLTSALSITPSYLRNDFSDSGLVTDYRDWQIPLGRRFRSLKIWFVLRTYGVSGLKAHIRQHIQLGDMFQALVRSRPDLFQVFTPPAFALTVLTIVPLHEEDGAAVAAEPQDGGVTEVGINEGLLSDDDDVLPPPRANAQKRANALTKEVYEAINAAGEIFLTSSVVKGVYTIRVVSANPKADEQHLRRAFEILVKTAEDLRSRKVEKGSGSGINGFVGAHQARSDGV